MVRSVRRKITFVPQAPPPIQKNTKFTVNTLCPEERDLRVRLSSQVVHWPVPIDYKAKSLPRCQLHGFLSNGKKRSRKFVFKCDHCNVFLCIQCFKIFHTVKDLTKEKTLDMILE